MDVAEFVEKIRKRSKASATKGEVSVSNRSCEGAKKEKLLWGKFW